MAVTTWVILVLKIDRPTNKVDPILMRGDNVRSVTWVNRCRGSWTKTAGLLKKMLGRLEIAGGWNTTEYIPGVTNSLADGFALAEINHGAEDEGAHQ